MATSVECDHDIQQLCLLSTAGISCMIGLTIHLFIVGVNIIDKLKGRPLTTADLLITCIGTSRFIFEFVLLVDLLCITFCEESPIAFDIATDVIRNCSADCSIWLSVLLSVFYSLKISNFHNVFFLYLKKIISQRVLGVIVVSLLLSISFSSCEALGPFVITLKNSTQTDDLHIVDSIMSGVFELWTFLPVPFYGISSFALLGSLCHHMHRMKHDQNARSHLDAYFKTMTFIIVSFICFALYVSTDISSKLIYDSLGFAALILIWNSFPVLHSIYIIYMTARLRSHLFKILPRASKCLLLRRSESRTGVHLQIISH